jgi:hypothetical protein
LEETAHLPLASKTSCEDCPQWEPEIFNEFEEATCGGGQSALLFGSDNVQTASVEPRGIDPPCITS